MSKIAQADYPVQKLIAERWSPYAFADQAVAVDDLLSCLEAARWAASSYNEQPWSYIVATRDEPEHFGNVLSCLVEANQVWAKAAPVLLLCCTSLNFARNGKPNAAAAHDLGLAAGNICLEATARGLCVHQMIGIDSEKAAKIFSVPSGVQVMTAIAIGYAADPNDLPEPLKSRETQPRQRKPISDFVFGNNWGHTAAIVDRPTP